MCMRLLQAVCRILKLSFKNEDTFGSLLISMETFSLILLNIYMHMIISNESNVMKPSGVRFVVVCVRNAIPKPCGSPCNTTFLSLIILVNSYCSSVLLVFSLRFIKRNHKRITGVLYFV